MNDSLTQLMLLPHPITFYNFNENTIINFGRHILYKFAFNYVHNKP